MAPFIFGALAIVGGMCAVDYIADETHDGRALAVGRVGVLALAVGLAGIALLVARSC